jgi:hypothetical protein
VNKAAALMEPGTLSFGGPAFIAIDTTTAMSYQDMILLPSDNPLLAIPNLLGVFTDREILR